MKLKTKILSVLSLLSILPLAHAQNYYFVMPVKGLVAQAQSVTYVSCKTIHEYIALRDQSTDLLYTLIQTGGYGIVNVNKAQTQASCAKLGDTLAVFILLHDEVSGCTGTGSDYSNIGYKNTTTTGYEWLSTMANLSNFYNSVSGEIHTSDVKLREQGVLFFR